MAENATELRETERRILGNLPAYRTPEGHEAAIVEALEFGTIKSAEDWPRGRALDDLTARLAKDRHCKVEHGDEDQVLEVIDTLVLNGLVETHTSGEFRMTEAGLAALTA